MGKKKKKPKLEDSAIIKIELKKKNNKERRKGNKQKEKEDGRKILEVQLVVMHSL
jgi:hypothetical protein